MKKLVLFVCLFQFGILSAQESIFSKANVEISPILNLQAWSTYTLGQEVFNEATGRYEAVDDRINFQMRRMNLGFKGKAFGRFQFTLLGAYDFVGRDLLTGPVGISNNGGSPIFRLWTAKLQWQAIKSSELLYLTFGYFPPQVSRESISSGYRVGTFEKAWSQNYIRRHIVGTGPGRSVGLNVGGMYMQGADSKFALSYNIGLFNPTFAVPGNISAGVRQSPVLAYQLAFHLGDPEFKKYSTGHKFNHFGKRKGLTLALSGTENGQMATWESNRSIGLDLLFNWNQFNLSGEWMQLSREGEAGNISSNVGHIKLGYNIPIGKEITISPVIAYVFFLGEEGLTEQLTASVLGSFSGTDTYWDFVLNVYFGQNMYLSLAYVARDGSFGQWGNGFTGNNYFSQGGIGAIQRGDYLGLGFVFLY